MQPAALAACTQQAVGARWDICLYASQCLSLPGGAASAPPHAHHRSSPTVSPTASASSRSDRQRASRPSPGSTLAQNRSMSCSQAPARGVRWG